MRFYLTVDRYNEGQRGIFRDSNGNIFWKDNEPHSDNEMYKIVGHYEYILQPMSIAYTEDEFKQFKRWVSFPECSNGFGVLLKEA